ncbi:hypothetical protein [Methylorubrum extorquens]|uniref:hypothetical protein n=1 Tax=Methylorubrum extorquens TaxID=408 RepID=UPI001EE52AAB|nr:hypothetical protein [Methylorubrum extorquens]MCG5244841.1 hypothetical protein [Methylorubrum extorquens]
MTTLHRLRACYHPCRDPDPDVYEDEAQFPVYDIHTHRVVDVRQHRILKRSTLLQDTAGVEISGYALLMGNREFGLVIRVPAQPRGRELSVRVAQYHDDPEGDRLSLTLTEGPRWIGVDELGSVMESESLLRIAAWHVCVYGRTI